MTTTWKKIWESRQINPQIESVCARLMAADGVNSVFSDMNEQAWREFVRHTIEESGIRKGASVFEVGCGAGAYLYPLQELGCRVAGLDASSVQVSYARKAMPEGQWFIGEAISLDPQPAYDFVVSCGVFHYFRSLEYAQQVVKQMVLKAKLGILVLDVPDLKTRDEAIAARRSQIGPEEYTRRYENLEHLYYSRHWFESELTALGFSRVRFDEHVPGGVNSSYRFNVYASRA